MCILLCFFYPVLDLQIQHLSLSCIKLLIHWIQYYVIKFVSDLQQVGCFPRVLQCPPKNKTDLHDITEILLKVALSTINLNQTQTYIVDILHVHVFVCLMKMKKRN